jgi:hypothetical protein
LKTKCYVVLDNEYKGCSASTATCSVQLPTPRFASCCACLPLFCVPIKKEVSPLQRHTLTHHNTNATTFFIPGLCPYQRLPHRVLRRAPRVGAVGLRNPVSFGPLRRAAIKFFGSAFARLLTLSRMMTSSSTTTSVSSTTTWEQHLQREWVFFRCPVCHLYQLMRTTYFSKKLSC